jgi:phage baseplate assembly protein W
LQRAVHEPLQRREFINPTLTSAARSVKGENIEAWEPALSVSSACFPNLHSGKNSLDLKSDRKYP